MYKVTPARIVSLGVSRILVLPYRSFSPRSKDENGEEVEKENSRGRMEWNSRGARANLSEEKYDR